MRSFAGITDEFSQFEKAEILLQSIPFDGTSTWGKGADKGYEAFIEASENMELYDIETDSEVYRHGISTLSPILEVRSPEKVFESVYKNTQELLKTEKFLTFFGGEHSISIGIIKAFYEKFPDISILHLDAHADLRPEYLGSKYNHACALHDAVKNSNVIHVGIRSMDGEEMQYLKHNKCFFAHQIHQNDTWMQKAIDLLNERVYITFDLDALDPSIMPSTGTPEPGGLQYYQTLKFLKMVFEQREVKGFDLVELAPINNFKPPEFLVAKLYYKMLSYKFNRHEN